jgi:glycosyltransferase involved in cell wall biosynthesis
MLVIGHGKIGRGLPMSVLEAQAAGVAVIAPSLRPDFDRFVLNGGGYIFKDESEIPSILKQVPDQARREMGFAHAAQYAMEGLEQELAAAGLKLQ